MTRFRTVSPGVAALDAFPAAGAIAEDKKPAPPAKEEAAPTKDAKASPADIGNTQKAK